MKKRLRVIIIIAITLMLAAPMAAYGEQAPPPGTTGGTLSVEYRFAEGQTPDIPQTIERFGFTYYLVSQSEPVLESTLPQVRTYEYRIEGALSPEQMADIEGLGEVVFDAVDVPVEREVNIEVKYQMDTNDVDDIPKTRTFTVTSAFSDTGFENKSLDLTGIKFAGPTVDSRGLPAAYEATAVYRGIETHEILGYYLANITYTTEEDDETNVYIIVAEYRTDEMPPPIDIAEESAPLEQGDEEPALAAIVSGDGPLSTLLNGDVPLGSISVTGAWSVLSLLFSMMAAAIAIVFALGFAARRKRVRMLEEIGHHEDEHVDLLRRRGNILRSLTITAGVATPLIWVIMENHNNEMVWINALTPIVAIPFALTVVFCAVTNVSNKKLQGDDYTDESKYAVA